MAIIVSIFIAFLLVGRGQESFLHRTFFSEAFAQKFYIIVECNFFSIRGYFFQDTKGTESEVIGGRVTEIYDPCSALLYIV